MDIFGVCRSWPFYENVPWANIQLFMSAALNRGPRPIKKRRDRPSQGKMEVTGKIKIFLKGSNFFTPIFYFLDHFLTF